jgi:IS5 family transposase
MRPKQHAMTGSNDRSRARLEQIINMKHELVQLAGKLDWAWIDGEIAPLYSDKGRHGVETRFVIGLLLLKHIYAPLLASSVQEGHRILFAALRV